MLTLTGRRGRGPSDRGGGGRGAYFKARYGGGGRGGSSNASQNGGGSAMNGCGPESTPSGSPGDWNALQSTLRSIDNQQYGSLTIIDRRPKMALVGLISYQAPTNDYVRLERAPRLCQQ